MLPSFENCSTSVNFRYTTHSRELNRLYDDISKTQPTVYKRSRVIQNDINFSLTPLTYLSTQFKEMNDIYVPGFNVENQRLFVQQVPFKYSCMSSFFEKQNMNKVSEQLILNQTNDDKRSIETKPKKCISTKPNNKKYFEIEDETVDENDPDCIIKKKIINEFAKVIRRNSKNLGSNKKIKINLLSKKFIDSLIAFGLNDEKWELEGVFLSKAVLTKFINHIKLKYISSSIIEDINFVDKLKRVHNLIKNGKKVFRFDEVIQFKKVGWSCCCELTLINEIIEHGNNKINMYLTNKIIRYQVVIINKLLIEKDQINFMISRYEALRYWLNNNCFNDLYYF